MGCSRGRDAAGVPLLHHCFQDWQYETIAVHVRVPAAGTLPVYRMDNNGQTGAPNHRFTTSLAVYQDFTTHRNWSGEGIRFCAPD